MSDMTDNAIRDEFGEDTEFLTRDDSQTLWFYLAILRELKNAETFLDRNDQIDLLETVASEAQRQADLLTNYDLGDLVREEMNRRENDPLSRERLEANGWDYVTTVDMKNPDWRIVLKKHMENMPELSGLPSVTIPYDDSMSLSQNETRLYEEEMKRLQTTKFVGFIEWCLASIKDLFRRS